MSANPQLAEDRLPENSTTLTALELRVVALARRNSEHGVAAASGSGGQLFVSLLGLLGFRVVRPLANRRLETLRQLAVALSRRHSHATALARFFEAGLTAGDIEAVKAALEVLPEASPRRRLLGSAGIIVPAMLLASCATAGQDRIAERDPLQKLNRGVWGLNNGIDRAVIKPVSTAYRKAIPAGARRGVTGVFSNLTEPWSAVNNLLQLKPRRAARNLGRFAVNTTVGIGGIRDSASKFGIRAAPEDLGQTFAAWGIGGGPYLVLPLFGPSTLRDGIGKIGGQFADPVSFAKSEANLPPAAAIGSTVLETVDGRAQMTEQGGDTMLQTSLDPYATARSVYLQQRRSEILNQDSSPSQGMPMTAVPAQPLPGVQAPAATIPGNTPDDLAVDLGPSTATPAM